MASALAQWSGSMSAELGWTTVYRSSHDTKLLCAQKFVRMFAYGSSTLVLALFLGEMGLSVARIGLFMTLTLLGDVLLSLLLTLTADGLGRRRVLAGGALLMAASGALFALGARSWLLLLASVLGIISPSGNEIGPFAAVEESILAQLTARDSRGDVLAWYMLMGSAGAAVGTLVAGAVVQALERSGWSAVAAHRAIFALYGVLGLVKAGLALLLSPACEAEKRAFAAVESRELEPSRASAKETTGLEDDDDDDDDDDEGQPTHDPPPPPPSARTCLAALLPTISPESRSIVIKLCALFAIDSFASGLVPTSWQTYYFTTKFALAAAPLGRIFSLSNLLASASSLAAASLARRVGLVRTMVATHLPSSLFLALIPLPAGVGPAAALLFLRASTASMDRAPRQAFLAAAVLPAERTAVMGVVNVVKTLAQSGGPAVTGRLAEAGRFWLVFLIAGGLKATYDFAMLGMFLSFTGREESSG